MNKTLEDKRNYHIALIDFLAETEWLIASARDVEFGCLLDTLIVRYGGCYFGTDYSIALIEEEL